jgi:cobalt-zinc-cadmium efflux system membrane fusion protein
MNLGKTFKYYSIILLIVLVAACKKDQPEEPKHEEEHAHDEQEVELTLEQIENAGVMLGKVEQKQISGTIRVNGVLDVPPQQLISISVPLGGFLKYTDLLQGSKVKKGQVIARVENMEFIQMQQDYLEAKGSFEFSAADYKRQQELAKDNVNSEKTLQQAKANYTTWMAKYKGLQEKLKMLNLDIAAVEEGNLKSTVNLFSPINGYVTQVNVNTGKYVTPTDVLFEIVDTEHLHAELIVFEKDVPRLRIGQKVRFTLANEAAERMATVYLIGREISADRTVQIHCHIDKEDRELLPGMYLNALVETSGNLVRALPADAIVDYQGRKYIFIAATEDEHADSAASHSEGEAMHFQMVEVALGNTELGYTEIKLPGSLNVADAEVVIKGAYAMLSKMKNSEEEGGHAH